MESCRQCEAAEKHHPPVDPVHDGKAGENPENAEEAVQGIGNDCALAREAGILQQLGAVVHDRVDAGQLLENAKPDPNEKKAANPRSSEVGPTARLGMLFFVRQQANLCHLGFSAFRCTNLLEHGERLGIALLR
jgi:hypothetical protein